MRGGASGATLGCTLHRSAPRASSPLRGANLQRAPRVSDIALSGHHHRDFAEHRPQRAGHRAADRKPDPRHPCGEASSTTMAAKGRHSSFGGGSVRRPAPAPQ
jgi:hypothetical protein